MKTLTVLLTSNELPQILPSVLDHYLIMDPGCQCSTFPYPLTADGGTYFVLNVEGSGDTNADGVYRWQSDNFFAQDSGNGFTIQLSANNWILTDSANSLYYYTPLSGYYSLADSWMAQQFSPAPTVSISGITDTTYSSYVCGGFFFPWGYQVQDQYQYITLPDLKGDTTITFCPSAIDTTYHDILKIIYDGGQGDPPITINRPILPRISGDVFTNFLATNLYDSPIYHNVSFNYRTSSIPVTFYPSVTALYGDLTRLFFYYQVTVYPGSVYDIDGVHLLAMSHSPAVSGGIISFLAVESRDSIVSKLSIPSK